jgi:fatty-acyl-CoA synthase
MDVFSGEGAAQIIENEKITVVTAVDQIFNEITKAAGESLGRLSSLRSACVVFSAKDPRTEIGRLEKELPLRIIQPYGLSEGNAFSITGCLDDSIELRAKAGGRPVGATEAKVIDPTTGERLQPGKSGELCIRGSNVTLGYYKNPEATKKAIDDAGWFHTGDLAVEEENGYFFFLGRIKDILKMKGFTVSPGEIEFYLLLHPSVEQCQVIGLPAKHGDDAAIACVIPKDRRITEAELLSYCKQGMASFKVPQKVLFMDSYPVTKGPHGDKVQKNRLRELVAAELNMATT